jgi:hypothetical protein
MCEHGGTFMFSARLSMAFRSRQHSNDPMQVKVPPHIAASNPRAGFESSCHCEITPHQTNILSIRSYAQDQQDTTLVCQGARERGANRGQDGR